MEILLITLMIELGVISVSCVALAAWVVVRRGDSESPKLGGAFPLLFPTGGGKEEAPKIEGEGKGGGQYL